MASPRLIRLRYPAVCAGCTVHIEPSTRGWWDPETRLVRCETCGSTSDAASPGDYQTPQVAQAAPTPTPTPIDLSPPPPPLPPPPPGAPEPAPIRSGTPGASAAREYERRVAREKARTADMKARHPILGRIVAATQSEPQTTTAWAIGAKGERGFGSKLDALRPKGVIALHDRRIPGSRANIDHIAIAASGVWVIDVKRYSGKVHRRTVGLWPPRQHLYVGRRDCTKLVHAMSMQVDTVRHVLLSESIPVHPTLSFQAEWPLFTRPFRIDGVLVGWGKVIRKRIRRSGPLDADEIDRIARLLDARLPPA